MKKIIYTGIIALMTISCSDSFLELAPESYTNSSGFYKTESHFEMAVTGTYESLRSITNDRGRWLLTDQRSDNAHYDYYAANRGTGSAVSLEHIADFIDEEDNRHANNFYYNCYEGISRANTILDRIEGVELDADFEASVTGEAKFLRAFFYFDLVRLYGGVPLYLNEVQTADEAFLPRASVEEVYAHIESDLTDAISKLDAPSFPQDGRATQGAARMLLAKVLMTKPSRDFAGAETQLREIMTMGYDLLPDYTDIYDPANKNHRESIFEVQYQEGDQGQESNFAYRFFPKTGNDVLVTGLGSNILTRGGWNMPTQEMVDSYEDGDERLAKSIAVAVGSADGNGMIVIEDVLNPKDAAIDNYQLKRYFVKKYLHPHSKPYNMDENWPLYRYADALLMLSECLLEQSKGDQGLAYLNEVRSRAGLEPVGTLTDDVIANERRHELAFEAHRWFDLLRTDKAIEVMTAFGERTKAMYPYLQDRTYDISLDKLLYAIPYREMQLNDELEQNPGY
ncbi:RagB/SusD family nutrient uptake outer membrane protein [Sunxiuqinia indica]|uniref:RagB/SusD family nutrient uptake outer membrane protein n=1 Tax=Sunxiuqinia indica TaxID=2692584 RepID=UPI001356E8CC|nr:RagB/SusD family nutrient uptake outer membrane protein [Sunxiuqinia indica]